MLTIHLLVYCPVIAQLTLVPVPFPFPFRIELFTLRPLAGHLQMQLLRHRLSVAIHRDRHHFLLHHVFVVRVAHL